ncbi:hypothetical protein [Acinetobacter modestus]|uniref:hypothetical protein n=1 Tax=Acinetobacter modestus TaxID=1776740 RepID=UPI003015FE14
MSSNLNAYLAEDYKYIRQDIYAGGYSILYQRIDGDVTISVLVKYLEGNICKSLQIRADYNDLASSAELELFTRFGFKIPNYIVHIIKDAVAKIKYELMNLHAPDWAKFWCISQSGQAWWMENDTWLLNELRGGWSTYNEFGITGRSEKAPSFGYIGDWKASYACIRREQCQP